ncbi:hypothetical protein CW368_09485 [Actinomycetales bacterium SN12]|nr:hypothetical protein CW368_09485 [Actinomycetales bacterium SN12]
MLNQAESSRRRELQRRAFAAGGGASEAELAELRELDARAGADAVIAPAPAAMDAGRAPLMEPPADPSAEQPAKLWRDAAAVPVSEPAAASPTDEHESSGSAHDAAPRRRRPGMPALILSTLIALLLGFGGGWMLLSRDDAPAMTSEQAKAMAEIEKTARFDAGSVTYLGEQYDAAVWRATAKDGEEICLAIHVIDRSDHLCMPPPDEDTPFAQPVGVSLNRQDGDAYWSYWATLVTDIAGREALIVQRHDMSAGFDWEAQYTEEERRYIGMLEAEGVVPTSLQIIGYDGDVPIFISQDVRTCIHVVDPATEAVVQSCDPTDDGLYILQVQDATYEVRETSMRGPILTIVRNDG